MRNELPYRTQTYIYIHLMEYIQAKIVGHDDACHGGCLCAPLLQGGEGCVERMGRRGMRGNGWQRKAKGK